MKMNGGIIDRAPDAHDVSMTTDDLLSYSPMPESPVPGKSLAEADPELYAAWRDHMRQGFENNQVMFEQILRGFMNPYWTTVWMYRILFGVGVSAFIVAALLAVWGRGDLTIAIFGGLSVASFVAYFVNHPAHSKKIYNLLPG
ncbi:MAG: hypothetical protein R2932_24715 [Caldilineaceae bacterium]